MVVVEHQAEVQYHRLQSAFRNFGANGASYFSETEIGRNFQLSHKKIRRIIWNVLNETNC